MWSVYFLGVASGLIALGHAAAIVSAAGGSAIELTAGAMLVSFGSAVGSIACGWLADRISAREVLTGCLVLVCVSMVILAILNSPTAIIAALGLAGLAYGALITIIPVVVARAYAKDVSMSVFGRGVHGVGICRIGRAVDRGRYFRPQSIV